MKVGKIKEGFIVLLHIPFYLVVGVSVGMWIVRVVAMDVYNCLRRKVK